VYIKFFGLGLSTFTTSFFNSERSACFTHGVECPKHYTTSRKKRTGTERRATLRVWRTGSSNQTVRPCDVFFVLCLSTWIHIPSMVGIFLPPSQVRCCCYQNDNTAAPCLGASELPKKQLPTSPWSVFGGRLGADEQCPKGAMGRCISRDAEMCDSSFLHCWLGRFTCVLANNLVLLPKYSTRRILW
jgi:hypothetical protein